MHPAHFEFITILKFYRSLKNLLRVENKGFLKDLPVIKMRTLLLLSYTLPDPVVPPFSLLPFLTYLPINLRTELKILTLYSSLSIERTAL